MSDSIVRLSQYTTLGVGGESKARILTDEREVEEALIGNPLVLGRGSNVLISDRGLEGVTVINRLCSVTVDGVKVTAQSGLSLPSLSAIATARGLSGFETLGAIPGSVGGAVRMNAGAFGKSISDTLYSALVLREGKMLTLSKSDLMLSYRKSALKESDFVVSATFLLSPSSVEAVKAETRRLYLKRRETQPNGKSAGSTYLKAEKPAGYYIEQAGLKGLRVGGAFVSEKHANFIINDGSATARDIYELMLTIERIVYEKFGVNLKREIKLFGEF